LWYNGGMKKTLRLVESLLVLLGLATVFVFIALYKPGWFPFQPSFGSNVIPIATMVAAWTTLVLAYAAFRTIENSNEQERRRRKEGLLNEIAKWSADVLKYCSSLTAGFNNELERSKAKDEYLRLKFVGENLITSAQNEALNNNLLNPLRDATQCFDGMSMNSLQDDPNKRTKLEDFCKTVRTEALKLLKNQ